MKKPFFVRYSLWILVAAVVATPLLILEAFWAIQSNTNKVQDWIPKTFAETGELVWFRQHFVADQFVVVSWDGCQLGGDPSVDGSEPDDPRIEQLAKTIVPDQDNPAAGEYGKYFKGVNTARRLLTRMTSPPSTLPYETALERLKGALIGPDGRQTAVVVMLTDEAVKDMRSAIGRGFEGYVGRRHKPGRLFDALKACGVSAEQARLGGPPVDNVSIDEEGDRTLVRLVLMAGGLGLSLAWLSLRSVRLTLTVFACGMLAAIASLAIVHLTGEVMDAVTMSMPSMTYILAISGAIHLINHYRESEAEHGPVAAPGLALKHGWKPAVFCNLTTAVGLASLYTSEIVPIRKFGMYSAVGVIATLAILFLLLPAALQIWPPKVQQWRAAKDKVDQLDMRAGIDGLLYRFWNAVGGWVIRHHVSVTAGCVVLTLVFGYGLVHVRTSIDLLKLFHSKSRILADYTWLERHLGRLVPMELVLRFDADAQATDRMPAGENVNRASRLSFLDRLETVAMVQDAIEQQFGVSASNIVGPSMSARTFAPSMASDRISTLDFAKRSAFNRRLEQSRESFLSSGFFQVDPNDDAELWRVSLRVAAFQNVDYGTFVHDIQRTVEPVVASCKSRGEVIREVMAKRQGERYAGATVLLWDQSGQPVPGKLHTPEQVFSKALKTQLTRARLRVVENDTDPGTIPVTKLERLRDYDCVVLVGDFSDANVQMIRHQGCRVVDTRADLAQQFEVLARHDRKIDRETHAGISVVYTGVVPIVYKAQRSLLDSLISSTVWSFITITPLVMLVTRSPLAGLVMMLPNILPVLMVFGGMGWTGTLVDIGAMMSASIALGVAVDDTIHYITWFREDLDRLGDRKAAILCAYSRCATPTTQAAIVNGLGLSVFVTSTFMPTQRFGYLMLVILVAGLVAELVMLPAILAGPLGVVFQPRLRKPTAAPQAAPSAEGVPALAPASHAVPAPHTSRMGTTLHGPHRALPAHVRRRADARD